VQPVAQRSGIVMFGQKHGIISHAQCAAEIIGRLIGKMVKTSFENEMRKSADI
jgi:hypothetical protein